jgi:malate dehydrogenase
MVDVAILGAGELGGSLAHVLARRDVVRRIQLIDPSGQIAAGKALDIMQSSPVERFTTTVAGTTDLTRVAGCGIVVIADRAKAAESTDPLLTLKQMTRLASRAVIVCADIDGCLLVERAARELQVKRTRIVGSAPEALAASLRALVALRANASVRDVALTVIGAPPAHAVVDWESATIAGYAATRVLDEPHLRRLSAQVGPLWPPGPHALAHAAAEAVGAICGRSRRTVSGFVAPDDSSGRRTRCVALPVRLGTNGIVHVEAPTLSVAARIALDNAMLL